MLSHKQYSINSTAGTLNEIFFTHFWPPEGKKRTKNRIKTQQYLRNFTIADEKVEAHRGNGTFIYILRSCELILEGTARK